MKAPNALHLRERSYFTKSLGDAKGNALFDFFCLKKAMFWSRLGETRTSQIGYLEVSMFTRHAHAFGVKSLDNLHK